MVSGITSLVAVIPLNGVPPGHYYVAVAARNIVGLGKSNRESVTGTCMHTSVMYALMIIFFVMQ